MPKLMERSDWVRTVASFCRAGAVWSETVNIRGGLDTLVLPESGAYQVVFVKLEDDRSNIRRIGTCKGKWCLPTWGEDKAMDRELESEFLELSHDDCFPQYGDFVVAV